MRISHRIRQELEIISAHVLDRFRGLVQQSGYVFRCPRPGHEDGEEVVHEMRDNGHRQIPPGFEIPDNLEMGGRVETRNNEGNDFSPSCVYSQPAECAAQQGFDRSA